MAPADRGQFNPTPKVSEMNASHRLVALPLALLLSAGAFATDADADAVAKLKSSLTRTSGFKVDDVRSGAEGTACISYRVNNEQGATTRAQAVVQGDKVLRSTSRSKDFEKAWNGKCAAGRDATDNAGQ